MRGRLTAWAIDLPHCRWDLTLTDEAGEQWGVILLPVLWGTQHGRLLWSRLTTLGCDGIEVELVGEAKRDAYGGTFVVSGVRAA